MRLIYILKNLKIIILGLIFILSFSGCSASSSSQRYGQSKSKNEEPSKSPRYGKTETNKSKENSEILVLHDLPDTTGAEFDETPIEDVAVDKSKFVANYDKLKNFNVALTPREKMLFEVIKYLDTPYKYGGNTEKGIDCSAFTKTIYESSQINELPRSAREQFSVGDEIDQEELKFGDLVFFNTTRRSFPGHVGIYLGDNQFVHASRKLGVTVSSLESTYYKKRYVGARRVGETQTQ